MSNIKVSEKFNTRNHGIVTVLDYIDCRSVLIKFENSGAIKTVRADHLRCGNIKDQTQPTVYGVGVIGLNFTKYESNSKEYSLWLGMLQRCYDNKLKNKRPSYLMCEVDKNFLNYEYFKAWCNKQIGFNKKGFALDKDILIKGNKLYSEDTCCFVPTEINSMIAGLSSKGDKVTGIYQNCKNGNWYLNTDYQNGHKKRGVFSDLKEAELEYLKLKTENIKSVAEKWKSQIDIRVYNALINWEAR
jgi:hypothetical protein